MEGLGEGLRTIYIALLHQLEHPQAQHCRQGGGHDRIPPHALHSAAARHGGIHLGPCGVGDLRPGVPVLGSAVRAALPLLGAIQQRLLQVTIMWPAPVRGTP